ncbi:MAG: S41 family peptidase [bacterium]|nr:S41 family peptidase [bacterium]
MKITGKIVLFRLPIFTIKSVFFTVIICISIFLSIAHGMQEGNFSFPETPAGQCASAYFKAFNSNDDKEITDFITRYRKKSFLESRPIKDRLNYYHQFIGLWQNLTPVGVAFSSENEIILMSLVSAMKDDLLIIRFKLEDNPPHKIALRTISGINKPPVDLDEIPNEYIISIADRVQSINNEIRDNTIELVAKALKENYVFPDIGTNIADTLIRNHSRGKYNEQTKAGKFADKLNQDLYKLCKDRHLGVDAVNIKRVSMLAENRDPKEFRSVNYGFSKAEVFRGNVGYVKFDYFHDGAEALDAAAAAMAFVTHCDALIFDIRENIGGGPDIINILFSYLLSEPVKISDSYDRNGLIESLIEPTLMEIPGKRFASDLPIYILTSKGTGSAAEAFAYSLKHLERAIIVGETTIGSANPCDEFIINEFFRMTIPVRRGENVITKTNWEGVGVIPHIAVPESEALGAALKDAKMRIKTKKN